MNIKDTVDFSYDAFLEDHLSFRDAGIETYTHGLAKSWLESLLGFMSNPLSKLG